MADRDAGVTAELPPTDPVRRAVAAWCAAGYVAPDAPLVVACSGGADSLALAAALAAVRSGFSGDPPTAARGGAAPVPGLAGDWRSVSAVVIVDHGLQSGSADVARAAARTIRGMGYDDVEVVGVAVGRRGGMEAAARAARYHTLREALRRRGSAAVLLAHTADDQAETVLLGLGRGSGPRSIAGMRPWAAPWGRPLLGVRRAQTESACRAAGVTPWIDPHNANPAFTRVRLRREVIPLLDEVLGGGAVPALARTAELMADDLAALDELAERVLAETRCDDGDLDCLLLATWPSAVRRRVLRQWARHRAGRTDLTYRHLVALEKGVLQGTSGYAVRLPGGIDAVRTGGRLRLSAAPSHDG